MGPYSASRLALLAAAVLLAVPLFLPAALGAVVEEGDRVLSPGESVEVLVEHTGDDRGLLFYWVTVYWGAPVDVWVVPERGWEQYHDEGSTAFERLTNGSVENVTVVSGRLVELKDPGVYYVIIENPEGNGTGEDSSIHYRVEYRTEGSLLENTIFWIVVVVTITIVLFVVGFDVVVRQSRRRADLDREKAVEFERLKGGGTREAKRRPPRPPSPPTPPTAYPEEVVRESMRDLGHDEDWDG